MLDFKQFNDDVYIYKSQLDEWGISEVASEGTKAKGTVREQIDLLTMQGQKGKNVVIKYTISLSNTTDISPSDIIGIYVNGNIEKFEIQKLSISRDLSGQPTIYNVWI